MFFSHSPVIFIACIVGMAFFATLVWFGFFLLRHRPAYLTKRPPVLDAEQALDGGSMRAAAPNDADSLHRHHPPVYCVDDHLACPPPSYQAVLARPAAPTPHELRVLHRRLEKLHRHRRRSSPADVSICEAAIRDSEIRGLAQWIERLQRLQGGPQEQEQDAGPLVGPRPRLRLVPSDSEPAGWATVRASPVAPQASFLRGSAAEPGFISFAQTREVPRPPTPTVPPSSPTAPADMDVRFAELREQLMRTMPRRYSTER